jgi:protein-tyrosine phosphatase
MNLNGADHVHGGLWQGSRPPQGKEIADAGFDVLVLTAMEYQPPSEAFPGVRVLHTPLDDAEPTAVERSMAFGASAAVAEALKRGKRVLVTCQMGLNRSGWVVARALQLGGVSRRESIAMVRRARGSMALCNDDFVADLMRPAKRHHGQQRRQFSCSHRK